MPFIAAFGMPQRRVAFPAGVFERVLHIEEEDADRRGEVPRGQADEREGLPAEGGECQVGPPDAGAHLGLVAAVAEGAAGNRA